MYCKSSFRKAYSVPWILFQNILKPLKLLRIMVIIASCGRNDSCFSKPICAVFKFRLFVFICVLASVVLTLYFFSLRLKHFSIQFRYDSFASVKQLVAFKNIATTTRVTWYNVMFLLLLFYISLYRMDGERHTINILEFMQSDPIIVTKIEIWVETATTVKHTKATFSIFE